LPAQFFLPTDNQHCSAQLRTATACMRFTLTFYWQKELLRGTVFEKHCLLQKQ
jgi:hypothetical protein